MATKTIADKLQIKPNTSFWISHPDHLALIGPLPTEAHLVDELASASVGLIVGASAADVRASLDAHREQITAPAILWVAYPKGNKADINRDSLWKIVADYGLRPNGQIALDDTWSALRFRANREGEEVFTGGRS
jgi:hypothetical protein